MQPNPCLFCGLVLLPRYCISGVPLQLSPAGLRQLQLMRRRLIAAHSSSSVDPSLDPAAAATAAAEPGSANSSRSSKRISRRRAKLLQLPALYLVDASWVLDSLSDLAQQQQQSLQQQQGRHTVVRRQSELTHEPAVLLDQQQQEQQQQVQLDEATAAGAAAAGGAAEIRSWPWQAVGLSAGDGGDSSSESAGECTCSAR